MSGLQNTRILLGISGGIAAYKTPQLVRLLRNAGADIQVVMTSNAHHFVTATSLQAVAGKPVRDNLWDPAAEASMGHIELARWADLILLAPATADTLSRLATGRADDLLGALCLASEAPLYIAPAMNQVMWQAQATQRNVASLVADGVRVLGPASGDQACGETGPGRMLEPEDLVAAISPDGISLATPGNALDPDSSQPLLGRHVVVTAGPTREALDPVRYISNHSSGKQGYAFAEAARDAGARVSLISGPVNLPPPDGVTLVQVTTARDMCAAALDLAGDADLFAAVAAVADYRPATQATEKIKKLPSASTRLDDDDDGSSDKSATGHGRPMTLELVENPDIVASVAGLPGKRVVLGFAAETHNPLEHGRSKLQRKGLDAIVVNDVSRADIGFNSDDNAATLIWAEGETQLAKQSKYHLARSVIQQICTIFVAQLAHTNPEDVAM